MAIKTMANCGPQVLYTAEELGAALRTFANNTDYVIKGIGNQMSMTYSSSSLDVTVKTGEAMMCGRFIMINSNEKVTLPANTSGKLVLRIDLTKPVKFEGLLTYVTGTPASDNLNNSGGKYDMVLAEFITSASGVTTLTDKRVIKDSAGSGGDTPTPPTPTPSVTAEQLWVNSAPTSNWAGGDITISTLGNYKFLIFEILSINGNPTGTAMTDPFHNFLIVPNIGNRANTRLDFGTGGSRYFSVSGTTITFSHGGGSTGYVADYDYRCIVYKIYGIK